MAMLLKKLFKYWKIKGFLKTCKRYTLCYENGRYICYVNGDVSVTSDLHFPDEVHCDSYLSFSKHCPRALYVNDVCTMESSKLKQLPEVFVVGTYEKPGLLVLKDNSKRMSNEYDFNCISIKIDTPRKGDIVIKKTILGLPRVNIVRKPKIYPVLVDGEYYVCINGNGVYTIEEMEQNNPDYKQVREAKIAVLELKIKHLRDKAQGLYEEFVWTDSTHVYEDMVTCSTEITELRHELDSLLKV